MNKSSLPLTLFIASTVGLSSCGTVRGWLGDDDLDLTVITYNIRVGSGPGAKRLAGDPLHANLLGIAGLLRSQQPDIVLLQEVDRGTDRSGKLMQDELLAQQLGFHHYFSKGIEVGGGDYGTAILSRWPLRETETFKLYQHNNDEQRTLSRVVVDTPAGPLLVLNTHLGLSQPEREKQFAQIADHISAQLGQMPIVLGGDMNAQPGEQTIAPVRYRLKDAWSEIAEPVSKEARFTFSAEKPTRTIDYIFVSPDVDVVDVRVLPDKLSDHLALKAELRIEGD